MTEKTAEDRPHDVATLSPGRQRTDVIRAGVLAALGSPKRLLKIAVHPLWGNNFRVNVWIGEGAIADAIPNSYFVNADQAGSILKAEPPIQKQY